MSLPEVFTRYRADIDAELRAVLHGLDSPLYDMMRYHLGWIDAAGNPLPKPGGKALRPTLCLLACQSLCGEYRRALPAAAAIELVHNYSLIHDDIQDDDTERRHRPTVWSIWGKAQAINAGTGMRMLASLALDRLSGDGISTEKIMKLQNILNKASLVLIEGQHLDISYETRNSVGVDDYLTMIKRKTAALIAASFEMGALIANDDPMVAADFWRLGENLGIAFKIQDDILGIWGNEGETGKPAGSDIRKKKKTLPIIYALGNATGKLRAGLVNFYRNGTADIAPVLNALEAVGARRKSQELAGHYHVEAKTALSALPLAPASRRELEEIVAFLVERNY